MTGTLKSMENVLSNLLISEGKTYSNTRWVKIIDNSFSVWHDVYYSRESWKWLWFFHISWGSAWCNNCIVFNKCHLLVTLKVMNTYVAFSAKRKMSMQKPIWGLIWFKCVRCTFSYSRAESGHLLSDPFVSLQYAQNWSNFNSNF